MQATTVQYAGFWRRALALLLDVILLIAITTPALYLIYGRDYFSWSPKLIGLFSSYGWAGFIITRLLAIILVLVFWVTLSATPGKRLLHCKIVDIDSLQAMSFKQAIIRLISYIVSALPLYLGFFWIGWDKHKQGFHDKLANTVVIIQEDDYERLSLEQLVKQVEGTPK